MTKIPWPYSVMVSGLSFTLFSADWSGYVESRPDRANTVILITVLGLLYGTVGIVLLAVMVWALSQAGERGYTLEWAISTFALGYSATFVYALSGLIFSLAFGWKTAVAFGVTGVLWALRPTLYTIKQMSEERVAFSIAMTTLCGAILLIGWAVLGKFAG